MAKSLRSKVKRTFRNKKRESGIYAATEAARLQRLNAKLISVASKDRDGDVPVKGAEGEDLPVEDIVDSTEQADAMELETTDKTKPVSTHGPRGSRREEWRASKGLSSRPKSVGSNRQGGVAAKRKAGHSHRRR